MAEYSSRSDELWNFAATLFEEESKSIPFAKQEEHWQIIQAKYSQLVSNLSCLGDIIAMMYQEKKLTLKELEQIQHLQSTPIRANEELLSIIARKPRDVFECFLILIKNTNQHHLYQMLVSGDETFDEANGKDASKHEDLIRRNFMWLSEKMDTENGLISLLYQRNVLTVREREAIFGLSNTFQRNEILLGMLSKKSLEDFKTFLNALDASGQGHLTKKLRQLQDSPADSATVTPGVSRPTIVDHKQRQRAPKKSGQLHVVVPSRCSLKPVPPPKPGTKLSSVQRYVNTAHTTAKSSKEAFTFSRTYKLKFQAWLRRLESRFQSDIAIKVTSVSLPNSDRPADYRTMWFHILLQECRQTRKEIVSRNDETNMELEQLRKSARQYSTAVTLNEVLRTQLLSMQQELANERSRSKTERKQLEESVCKLKTDINNEVTKFKRLEVDKLLNNTVIMEMKEGLSKAEFDNRCYLQQIQSLENDRISKLQEEPISEKHREQVFEDKLSDAIARLEQFNTSLDAIDRSFATQGMTQTVVFGRQEETLKARQLHPYDSHTIEKPTTSEGTLWRDGRFPFTVTQEGPHKVSKLLWKRPKEYAAESHLFGKTVNRYSVKQGQIGDCFFMSTLSSIADQPKLLHQILPSDAYDPVKSNGVFHCRFWWMGEWIDVYTDDLLPYNGDIDRVYGGHSKDKNVVWVPLMEKALARLCGSYGSVAGDQANAYALMTGGLVEMLKIRKREQKDEILSQDLAFVRVKQALDSGALVLTSIDQRETQNPLRQGLTTNHCYSINKAIKIRHGDATAMLLKVRNPWGETNKVKPVNDNGEWKGRWSYGSQEWNEVSKNLRKRHNVVFDDGGEFWVCVEDFYRIFERIYIADIIPNFDEDGFRKSNQLNKVINILGEWHGETAAGSKNLFKNPRFLVFIPNTGLGGDNRMPTVIQFILQYDHPVKDTDNKDNLYCRIDVFRVEKEQTRDNQLHMCLTDFSVSEAYVAGRESTCRHRLTPGKYILVPNFLDENTHRRISQPFCIRVFTATPLICREFLDNPVVLTGNPTLAFESNDSSSRKQVRTVNVFGEWKEQTAADSDAVNRMKNPRFILTIPGSRKVKISFQLRQRRDIDRTLRCRLDIFRLDLDVTRDNDHWIVMNEITNMAKFMAGGEVSYDYELESGNYLLLPTYSGRERINCAFCIRILAHTQVNCKAQEGNPTLFVRTIENVLKSQDKSDKLATLRCYFGEWVKDRTAGGQIRFNSFSKNPQYGLTVEGNAPQPVLISLMQENVLPTHPIGWYIIKIDANQSIPLDNETLKRGTRVKSMEGKELSFVQQSESSGYYMLSPGRYVILVFADQPTDEKKFALAIFAQKQSRLSLTEPTK